LDELRLTEDILWLKGSTGTYLNGVIYPLTTPIEILRYPHLTIPDKIKLGLFTKKVRTFDLSELDAISAEKFLHEQVGDKIYQSFFRPLLKSKFGMNAEKVSAAWLVSRVAIRSDRSLAGERLGYLNKGFSRFINTISGQITERGGEIRISSPVTSLIRQEKTWFVNDEPYEGIIATIAPGLLREIGVPISDVPYQGAACLTMGLKRAVTNGIYWINLYDNAPYGAVIGHTCFAPFSWYGEHIIYLASYFTGNPVPDLKEQMIRDFCKKFGVQKSDILWTELSLDPFAGPLYLAGYKPRMEALTVPGMSLAGMFSAENYPERSIEGSVRAGERAAKEIISFSQQEGRPL
jgi:protoporphyrinogen oxidase